jgi:hypothetical protein
MIEPRSWQKPAVEKLVSAFAKGSIVVNASDTGTGKTYVALFAAKQLGVPLFVIAPLAVHTMWRNTAAAIGVPLVAVINAEKVSRASSEYYDGKWHLPAGTMVVWDEVHKGASGIKSKATEALARLRALLDVKVLAQSATVADSPLQLRGLGYLLGLHQFNPASYYAWCRAHGCKPSPFHTGLEFPKGPQGKKHMRLIHEQIQDRLIRLKIADIPEFPECETQATLFDLDAEYTEEITRIWEEFDKALTEPNANPLTEMLRARQRTELLKVPLLIDLVEQYLEEDKSVVVFVCFRDTLKALELRFGTDASLIYGDQPDRDRHIAAFQANERRICIATAQAGGVGVSLHDVHKARQRVALLTPSWSAADTKQCLGRIHRDGGTKALQVFVLAAGTVEERIHKQLSQKLDRLDALTDADLAT